MLPLSATWATTRYGRNSVSGGFGRLFLLTLRKLLAVICYWVRIAWPFRGGSF